MDLSDKIFNYCERGQDPGFWAEPLNAITNVAFLIAALLAAVEYMRMPRTSRGLSEAVLVIMVGVIGVGSFLFHTYATRWASIADIAPIGIFMLAYVAYVLRRFVGLNWLLVVAGLAIFVASLRYAATIQCNQQALLPITAAATNRCLNGTVAYLPALIALAASAVMLAGLRHPTWRYLAGATVLLILAMTFRTLDLELCGITRAAGRVLGTHFMWHVLNASVLYILLLAALRHGGCKLREPVA
ncbi:MAG: ceramidase domain-containing protein [Hyphomicrobium sp.]|jgi:hypothetical protein